MNIHERIEQWTKEDGVAFFRQMNLPKGGIFLDFGSGHGEYSVALALSDASSTVYAVDHSAQLLKFIGEKAARFQINNIIPHHADFGEKTGFADHFADAILMYDVIHGNDPKSKLPCRFRYFEEAKRVLKPGGVLSIAPFHCASLKNAEGRRERYSRKKLIHEIEDCGYQFVETIDRAIHFEAYYSPYKWNKLGGDMPFDALERGVALNFRNI